MKLDNQYDEEHDDNGNRASVAEIRRKFDNTTIEKSTKNTNGGPIIEGKPISENRFKKQDTVIRKASLRNNSIERPILNGDVNILMNGIVEGDGRALGGAQETVVSEMGKNHTSNFASYIWSGGDYKKDEENGVVEQVGSVLIFSLLLLFFTTNFTKIN